MSSTTSACRITDDVSQTPVSIISALTGRNPDAMSVLTQWFKIDPTAASMGFLTSLDAKHLYDHHIWAVYVLCGNDIHRFIYHVDMELPNQLSGQLYAAGPYCAQVDLVKFLAKRKFGKPGSYWSLENPPTEEDYAYPIG